MTDPSSYPAQRASDADRDAVLEMLQDALSDGRLDLPEFEERMASAQQAKTHQELAPLTADLGAPGGAVGVPAGPGQEVKITSNGSSTRRTGAWVVPRKVRVVGHMGSVWLNMTEAKLTSRDVEVQVDATMGSLTVVVPEDTDVDTNDLAATFGSINVRTKAPDNPRTAKLRLVVAGKVHMGSVTVRHPGFFARWLQRRRARRAGN